jgi:pSer/pThr/pTyr-binding forkhead associated (FHA) protein
MRREREEPFDLDKPTLVVTYGNTTQKYRPLDRDVIVLGRSANCDLSLVAAEVAPIHCLLLRSPDGGWRVRHFGGRIGTLVNGKRVQDEAMDHGDTLQIGSFSFKLHLPPAFRRPGLKTDAAADSADSAEVTHLRRSRRNLVRLALNLRRRCHASAAELKAARQKLEQHERDLDALHETARAKQQALDTLRAKSEADERDFLVRRQALDQQEAALNERLRVAEEGAARYKAEAEAAIKAAEEVVTEALSERPEPAAPADAQQLEKRSAELSHFASQLQRAAQLAAEKEAELRRLTDELARDRAQLEREREEVQGRAHAPRPTATPALSARLAKVQRLKRGLAMLQTTDSAPGVPMDRPETGPHRTADVTESVGETPN